MTAVVSGVPRWTLTLTSGFGAIAFGWAAAVLPWRPWTLLALSTATIAAVQAATAVLAAIGRPQARAAWRVQSFSTLAYLAYLSWNLLTSAIYLARLYGGLGKGLAVGLAAAWAVVVLLTVPMAAWGLAASGGVRLGRLGRGVGGALGFVALWGLLRASSIAHAAPLPAPEPATLGETLAGALAPSRDGRAAVVVPAVCPEPPSTTVATAVVAFASGSGPALRCVQAPADALGQAIVDELGRAGASAPVVVDLITARQPLSPVLPVVDALSLRPGLDGACAGTRCFAPWQLLALDQFVTHRPIPVIPEIRFGIDLAQLQRTLRDDPGDATVEGLVRIETHSFVIDPEGSAHALRRMRPPPVEVSEPALAHAAAAAERYIVDAQLEDGRFRYQLDPFRGTVSMRGFGIPRQAGTTWALCDVGSRDPAVDAAARRSLAFLAGLARRSGDVAAPTLGESHKGDIGSTSLSLVALLGCRERLGDRHDPVIGAFARLVLALQREDGGFHPRFDLERGAAMAGPEALYAGGQAVLALVLLQAEQARAPARDWPATEALRSATARAMTYYAHDYWPDFLADVFFLEENWHCLAARAALEVERDDAYERFCLDYVQFKRRLILDERSRVDDDLLGSYGFGNVLLPHTTAAAGFLEASAAAEAVRAARGEPMPEWMRQGSDLALSHLLRAQWNPISCFACVASPSPIGAFSEHYGSSSIRIDYVQHALSALGHWRRMKQHS